MCKDSPKTPKPSDDVTPDGTDPVVEDPDPGTEEPPVPCEERPFGPLEVIEHVVEVIENATPGNEAWNGTFEWDAKFAIAISRLDCQITVTVRIKVLGSITQDQRDAWETAIETKWNGKVTLFFDDPECPGACPAGYSLHIDLAYVESGEHQAVTAQAPTIDPDGTVGLNGTTDMNGWGYDDTVDVTHEFGHMLGNCEEYFTTNGVDYTEGGTKLPFRDPGGGIMNNPANDPRPENYEVIARHAAGLMGPDVTYRIEALS